MTNKATDIKNSLDEVFLEVEKLYRGNPNAFISLPKKLAKLLEEWKYGAPGWTSPLNILLTASWYKWLRPEQDVCIIWSENGNGEPISGGYSVRSYDEGFTVPLVNKYDLYKEFCSSNSGMQGARSLEKARGMGRIHPSGDISQKVRYDLKLFAETLNAINEVDSQTAKNVFRYYLLKSIKLKMARLDGLSKLNALKASPTIDGWLAVRDAIHSAKDPQFVKTIAAACLHSISRSAGYSVGGLDSSMTGADARSGGPGDLSLSLEGKLHVGIEVKDSSRKIGYSILSSVRERISKNALAQYMIVVDSNSPLEGQVRDDPEWYNQVAEIRKSGCALSVMSLEQLWGVALITARDVELVDTVTFFISKTSSLKKGTADHWTRAVAFYSSAKNLP